LKIKFYKALWGMEGTYEEQIQHAASNGYAGIETPLPPKDKQQEFARFMKQFNMEYIAQVTTSGEHSKSFAEQVRQAQEFEPVLIVSHSARDYMELKEQVKFFDAALSMEKEVGIPIGHETHRTRAMFTPWTTARLLRELPELKITADFSHWCCVCESLTLEEHQEDLMLAMSRAIHIHGRIGYEQGAQVPHPAAPEYANHLDTFVNWWNQIIDLRRKQGFESTSITPEFGPPGYMHTLPFTNQPVSDLVEVNEWLKQYLAKKFQ
jgi:hypothetical protein